MQYYPGERIGDFISIEHKHRGKWLWRCVHCNAEKTTTFSMMRRTGMKKCKCQATATRIRHYPGEIIGDFKAIRHKRNGKWLFQCVHCQREKIENFTMMSRTGMKNCKCRKPLLTPAQQRVADLFAQGHRNCDIAKLLGIDHRTVSCHLAAIYERRLRANA